jgi:hypothetical protein
VAVDLIRVSALITASTVFARCFGADFLGSFLRRVIAVQHLNADSKDSVKLVMGLIATMAALVLSLLIASAKATCGTALSLARERGAVIDGICALTPATARSCQITRTPLLMFVEASGAFCAPFLVILVFWVATLYIALPSYCKTASFARASVTASMISSAGGILLPAIITCQRG